MAWINPDQGRDESRPYAVGRSHPRRHGPGAGRRLVSVTSPVLPCAEAFVPKFTNGENAMTATPTGLREEARQAIADQSARVVTVLSSLLAAQDQLGYLPPEALDETALRTGASTNEVWGVASFYPNFRFTPPARHTIEVCWGPTCHVLGAQPLLRGVIERLGLDGEGDTPDGAVTLKLNTCLGVCPHGPATSFDHEIVGRTTLESALRRIDLLAASDVEERRTAAIEQEAHRARAEREARAGARAADAADTEPDGPG